jgi:hypothetical protein
VNARTLGAHAGPTAASSRSVQEKVRIGTIGQNFEDERIIDTGLEKIERRFQTFSKLAFDTFWDARVRCVPVCVGAAATVHTRTKPPPVMMLSDRVGGRRRQLARERAGDGSAAAASNTSKNKNAKSSPYAAPRSAPSPSAPPAPPASSSSPSATAAAATAEEVAALRRANVAATRRAASLSAEAHSATETAKHMELGMRRLLKEFLASEKQARASERAAATKEAETEFGELRRVMERLQRELDDARRDAAAVGWALLTLFCSQNTFT